MKAESHHGVIVDRCPSCGDLWFDATELNRDLAALSQRASHPAWEEKIPIEGFSARSCPRCPRQELRAAGWGTLALERCPKCHGFLFDAGELEALEGADTEALGPSFEQTLLSVCYDAGWSMLGGKEFYQRLGRILDSIHKL